MSEPIRIADWLAKRDLQNWIANLPTPNLVPDEELKAKPAAPARMDQERVSAFEKAIPARYRASSFLGPVLSQRVASRQAIGLAMGATGAKQVVLLGPPGSGKTSLAVAMLRAAWEANGRPFRYFDFVDAPTLGVARIQHPAGHGEAEEVERAILARHLLLDDLGQENDTKNNAVPDVIFERHAQDWPTWITTGLTAEEIASRYGGGIARRIFEGATLIRLGGGK